jgi:hypothetical protein
MSNYQIGERVVFDSEPEYEGTVIDVAYVIQWDDADFGTVIENRQAIAAVEPMVTLRLPLSTARRFAKSNATVGDLDSISAMSHMVHRCRDALIEMGEA